MRLPLSVIERFSKVKHEFSGALTGKELRACIERNNQNLEAVNFGDFLIRVAPGTHPPDEPAYIQTFSAIGNGWIFIGRRKTALRFTGKEVFEFTSREKGWQVVKRPKAASRK